MATAEKKVPFAFPPHSPPPRLGLSLTVTDTWPPEASDRGRWFPTEEEGGPRDHLRRDQVRQAVGLGLGGASRRPRRQFVSGHVRETRDCPIGTSRLTTQFILRRQRCLRRESCTQPVCREQPEQTQYGQVGSVER